MKLRAFITHSLLSVTLLAVTTLAASIFALPGSARAQPEPTMVLSPPSGPCDAAIQVSGSGFPTLSGPMESVGLYLVQPGTADVNIEILNAASVGRDGTFSQGVSLREHGCEAATLDSQGQRPTGNLVIAARLEQAPVGPGERISSIIATAQYAYATTTPHIPTETLSISPASGPCDGAVEIRGSGFSPGEEVPLHLARPQSDDVMGRLATATADASGEFSVAVNLGSLGCDAAGLDDRLGSPGSPKQIEIYAGFRQDVLFVAARAGYGYTTTAVTGGGAAPPVTLPQAGGGAGGSPGRSGSLVLIGLLAGLGLVLVMASLYLRRKRT